jgi:hypothetical protein
MNTPRPTEGSKRTQDPEQTKHFEQKAKWKELPGNRYDLTKAEPPPKLDFHFDKELAGFQFDWA